ncbi:hypothetical protein GH714_004235 [Hevea brasiliensis]|uniref:Uncharacterized protein n=1 Tax=Hevea brasiliensis TaxID=3981 RepID=A0A6A6NBK3_HEVBR|nr:hypothetical protein GH714_004235 [Hevea brasiliensis]
MFSQFPRKHQFYGSLDLPRSNSGFLVVPSKSRGFMCKLLEDIVDKRVHDAHGLARDPDVRVHLLQNLEYVDLGRKM